MWFTVNTLTITVFGEVECYHRHIHRLSYIPQNRFARWEPDNHGFECDGDGVGCES
jgi:hypothetical protein